MAIVTSIILERNYRVDIIVDLVRLFGPPILIFSAVVSFIVPRTVLAANFSRPLLYVLISVLYWTAKVQITQWRYRQEAKKLGAVCFPKLRGKWPGNLDIIYLGMRSLKEGYIADSEEFFGDGDTFNMGAFWTNIYVTRSPTFIQHALATEPDFFPMGEDQCTSLHGMFGNGILATDGAEAKPNSVSGTSTFLIAMPRRPSLSSMRGLNLANPSTFKTCSNVSLSTLQENFSSIRQNLTLLTYRSPSRTS
ncbi:uncharacterized protein EI90DRAFT_707231 [Cantharellus anzutake]|uniref:uncharacterized protein n=1 Tax=Cantharellus anzutake TaxID=1750568 RepID=UPI001906325F|nr:uncharacterized protein EI90DRAFT_707231 [Cantharellus anzutake]KAF8332799.1 hypothetical protein EI90DRAFT_707231 [Cantharellus anzutake]